MTVIDSQVRTANIAQIKKASGLHALFSDIVGRIVVYPYEINIGLTIGVFGTIIFLILLMKGRKNYANER